MLDAGCWMLDDGKTARRQDCLTFLLQTAKLQNCKTAEPQNRRTAEPQNRRTVLDCKTAFSTNS
jgi:hypothetical protein